MLNDQEDLGRERMEFDAKINGHGPQLARGLCLNFDDEFPEAVLIRKLKSGKYRLYSRKKDPKTGKRRNLGTFDTREQAEKHERAVQFFKRHG
jgi:hypothetical protein